MIGCLRRYMNMHKLHINFSINYIFDSFVGIRVTP